MKLARIIPLCLGVFLTYGFAHASEVLVNGGFETGSLAPFTNDTRFGTGTGFSVTTTGCFAGTYCAVDMGNVGLLQMFAGVATSTISNVSFEINSAGFNAYDFFYAGGGDDEFALSTTSGVYNLVNATSNLRAGATLTGFEIFGNGSTTPTRLDNLSITTTATTTVTPEPSALWLMATGLGPVLGMATRRRRKMS